jgi:hypothetical protein
MKTFMGSEGIAPRILDPRTRWRWVVNFTLRPLYPQERVPGTHLIRGWVGPIAVLDAVVKRKITSSCRESNPRTPIVQPVVDINPSNRRKSLSYGRIKRTLVRMAEQLREPFEKFVDWRQCVFDMQREA